MGRRGSEEDDIRSLSLYHIHRSPAASPRPASLLRRCPSGGAVSLCLTLSHFLSLFRSLSLTLSFSLALCLTRKGAMGRRGSEEDDIRAEDVIHATVKVS